MNYDFLCIVNRGSDRRGAKVILQFFLKIGCQGDRMACHKAFAPCLRVTEGDRRVTGLTMDFTHSDWISVKWHFSAVKWHFSSDKCHFSSVECHSADEASMF